VRAEGALKVDIEAVCRVQTQTVDLELLHPGSHSGEQMLTDCRVTQVQLDEIIMPGPSRVVERVAIGAPLGKVEVIPIAIRIAIVVRVVCI